MNVTAIQNDVVQNFDFAMHHFDDLHTAPFDIYEYSRMKFGSNLAAKFFAEQMADEFFVKYRFWLQSQCVVIPAPSTTVSVAATMLSRHFMNRLNRHLDRAGLGAVEWTMIHRNMTYNNNYAHLPKEERKVLLAADTIYLNKDFVQGKTLLFVDDCRITGTHEEKIIDFLEQEGLNNQRLFITLANYDGQDASIEGRLNHVAIKDSRDLARLSHETGYEVTTRSLRLFLETPNHIFQDVAKLASYKFLEDVYYACIVKGYNRHDEYQHNFDILRRMMGS